MGNRAVITTREKQIGIYLHWNGGRDTIEPLLKYCELKGYRPPSQDCYGWARLAQVMGNFFGGSYSVGIDEYDNLDTDNWDNGVYIIDGWEIVGREFQHRGEQHGHDFDEMLRAFDAAMPEGEQLGGYLDAIEVPVSKVEVGDILYVDINYNRCYKPFEVLELTEKNGEPAFRIDREPDPEHYLNCYAPHTATVRIDRKED